MVQMKRKITSALFSEGYQHERGLISMNSTTKILAYMVALCFSSEVAESANPLYSDFGTPSWATLAPPPGRDDPTKDKKAQEMRPVRELVFLEDHSELKRWAREGNRDSQDELVQHFVEGALTLDKEADLAGFWEWDGLEQRILTRPGHLRVICLHFKDEIEVRLPHLRGRIQDILDSDPTDPLSQYILGYCYYWGLFFGQNDTEAAKWCLWAAQQGYATAQFTYGVMCGTGKGVSQSDTEAVKWYLRAAKQGHARAQSNYGFMCEKAAAQGHAEAKRKL